MFIRLVIQILKQYSKTQPEVIPKFSCDACGHVMLIRKVSWIEPNCMNRDGGAYSLPTAYDRLFVTSSTSRDHKPDEARRWRATRRN